MRAAFMCLNIFSVILVADRSAFSVDASKIDEARRNAYALVEAYRAELGSSAFKVIISLGQLEQAELAQRYSDQSTTRLEAPQITTRLAAPQREPTSSITVSEAEKNLSDASKDLLDTTSKVFDGKFQQPSFQCLDDMRMCETRYSYLDCQLAMIICICSSVLK